MVAGHEKTAVSLFSGAGGLDIGLEQAGWSVLAQVEMDRDCIATLEGWARKRRNPTAIIPAPIERVPPRRLRRELGLAKGELTLLAGGPPCQPFTTSGLRKGLLDPRASSLFPSYLAFVEEFRPQALLLENVDGMLSAALRHRPLARRGKGHPPLAPDEQKGSFLKWFVDLIASMGYSVSWGVTEAADYGVPQMRQRAILIGVHKSEPCYLPPPGFGDLGRRPYRDLAWALAKVKDLGSVQPLSQRKMDVYELIPPGGNWRNLPERVKRATMGAAYSAAGGKSGWWRRLAWDVPAPTILGMPDHSSTALIHPDETRCLSVNECAAIQTLPLSMRFAGTSRSQYQQIGNAVPPLLGRALGKHLADFFNGVRQTKPAPPPWRRASANRRIGTHGWAVPTVSGVRYHLSVRVRSDHVWANTETEEIVA